MTTDLIHEHLVKLSEAVARVETKVDALMVAKVDHHTRLDSLEMWRNRLVGVTFGLVLYACRDHLHTLLAIVSLAG